MLLSFWFDAFVCLKGYTLAYEAITCLLVGLSEQS